MSDSDGDDLAMAYFLPNGIADDSPPKRSAFLPTSSFGSIGAARFGGIYGPSGGAVPPALDLSAPLYGSGLGNSMAAPSAAPTAPHPTTTTSSSSSTTSSSRATFLLADLGGEILPPHARDSTGVAIGGGRPHAFASSSFSGGSLARSDRVGTPTPTNAAAANVAAPTGSRSDAEIFAPASGLGGGGVYGRATLNANAPAFLAASAASQEPTAAPFGSASPSAWPTMNVKPRRAPPGLSKPTDGAVASASDARALPPGLPHPSHASAFGGAFAASSAASSASLFSGDSVRQFASKLRPSFPSLSETFRAAGGAAADHDYRSALAELNAESLSVEEVQSNLKATALAAAHDVVADPPTEPRLTTPRRTTTTTTKSPRRGVDVRSPVTSDDTRPAMDPRARTPTRRPEAAAAAASTTPRAVAMGAASPLASTRASGDRRGRHTREQAASADGVGRNGRAEPSSTRSGRRARGGASTTSDARAATRGGQPDAASAAPQATVSSRKKPPSSISSVGSDEQLLTVATLTEVAEESRGVRPKVKESPKVGGRNGAAKKATTPVHHAEKRGAPRRQVYREKVAVPEPSKNEAAEAKKDDDAPALGGSDADASGADSQTDDNLDESVKETLTEAKSPSAEVVRDRAPHDSPVSPSQLVSSPVVPSTLEEDTAGASGEQSAESSSEPTIDASAEVPVPTDTENRPVPQSPTLTPSRGVFNTPNQLESDSGSEIPDLNSRAVRANDRKTSAKEHKKDKHKKDKADKKKAAAPAKAGKKEKRDSSSSGKGDLADGEPFVSAPAKKPSVAPVVKLAAVLRDGRTVLKRALVAICTGCWSVCTEFADRINLKGFLGWTFSYLESFLAVMFSVVLLLSLHGASFFIRLHRVAFRAVLTHRHVGFCFAFMYAFPFLVQYVFPWAPPWAPVCLWYAFLVQLFCTSGPAAMVATFRIVLPLMFLVEGISHHSFLLDLNGAELLLASFILSAMKTSNLCSPIFLMSLAVQCLSAVFLGSELVVQWFQMTLALYSLHAMAATDEDWAGLGDEEEELSCRPLSMHHSIADYNYHPAPSAPSIQRTKRLDRRALAYVRGRKLR